MRGRVGTGAPSPEIHTFCSADVLQSVNLLVNKGPKATYKSHIHNSYSARLPSAVPPDRHQVSFTAS